MSLSPGIIARERDLSEKVLEAGQADSKKNLRDWPEKVESLGKLAKRLEKAY
ncbi:MAG: hypothetical protein M3447_01595 [Acidobacteriota bacterium]|nr:hypothetical protein [Acidobacteriota bacterium]